MKMQRAKILIASLICTAVTSAQLYVSPNSYVFVKDQYVYVKQDVNLQANGQIYLRNQSQLLQGSAAASANQGAGKLSVFQEGTVDNYEYNYWCSPVGNASAAIGNENFGITMLNQPTGVTTSTPAVMLGSGVLDGVASPLQIAPRWVFKFLSSTTYSQWFPVGSATTIGAGEGFTMKGTAGTDNSFTEGGVSNNPGSAQRYDFRGKPNDGNINITVTNTAGNRTLTGNPYPSAIDLQQFLLTANNPSAANCTGIAYFWEQDKSVNSHYIASYQGGYGTYAAGTNTYTPPTFYAYDAAGTQLTAVGTGSNYPRRFAPIGQGFMIEGTANGVVTMKNNTRVYLKEGATSHFDRTADAAGPNDFLPYIPSVSGFDYTTVSTLPNPQIRFNILLNNQGVRQTALTFHPDATDGIDHAMDAKSPGGGNIDSYFVLDNNEYVMDAIKFDVNKKIPIGFKNDVPASFRIAVCEMLNFSTEHVYLHDKLTGTYHNIKDESFEFALPAGVNNTRYEITFVDDSLLSLPELTTQDLDVLQNNALQQLSIANPKSLEIKAVYLFDTAGKQIFSKEAVGSDKLYKYNTAGISDEVYIVKVITADNRNFTKKITVYNKH